MEQIEVNIKLASNNQVYNLPIRKSESIIKLKEYCQIISNIPQDQQILLYKGKMLLNEKLIKDYDIENNQEIILAKREEQKPMNIGELLDSANNTLLILKMTFFKEFEFLILKPSDIIKDLNKKYGLS